MAKLLWEPSPATVENANMTRFIRCVNRKHGLSLGSYDELWDWSVNHIPDFWASMWEFAEIKASQPYTQVVDDLRKFPGVRWFPGARLNFAENLLRYKDDRPAFVFKGETQKSSRMTYAELNRTVARLAVCLRQVGVQPGDRVAGYMPNIPETAIAMLSATAIGATWSSCATDLGAQAALDRLGQIGPKVLFTADGYFYKGKPFDTLSNAAIVVRGIPSLRKVIVTGHAANRPDISGLPNAVLWEDFLSRDEDPPLQFEQLPFDHPGVIMFSSGTTGKPKCIVQTAGGVLLNHIKELSLHSDLKHQDVIFYITGCSWMMWNWLLSSLAIGATIVLYDGNPNYPDAGAMWKLVQDERITVFGCSATYINAIKSLGLNPGRDYDLSSLRQISQTGSALSTEGYEYLYQAVKKDLHFNSISGGTDINGCFVAGGPTVPVYAGQAQRRALAMKVECYDPRGKPIRDDMGELVCEAPAPSMPIYFWDDPEGKKYRDAYFGVYPNVWRHGDYIMVHSDTGGVSFFGRSDAVLKPSGVRIGTAEIYNQVEKLPEIADSLAIGQDWKGDQRVILFVKLAGGMTLTEELKTKIKKTLRDNASPRHAPDKIIAVPDIPYTLNMKKVETAITNIVHGRPVTNRDALANPESLDYYESLRAEIEKE
ncbi:MAG: acetoacetate--CoA ligase [Chloroflexi bacterium]|nr:acetoacetate--CoA ligase [Chloroflexota bacterium]